MAKGYERREYRGGTGMGYGSSPDQIVLQKLGEVVSDLYMSTDERDRPRLWSTAARLLAKTKADKERVAKIMLEKRVGALSKLVTDLQQQSNAPVVRSTGQTPARAAGAPGVTAPNSDEKEPSSGKGESTPIAQSQPEQVSPDQLKHAMKAFRKRLKLTRLDEESRLGSRAMTGGRKSAVVAIMPPREYSKAVWDELVRQGKLKNAGGGFLELVEGA